MSEYRDIHNNVYQIIQKCLAPTDEIEREDAKEIILEDLFNIFAPAKGKNAIAKVS